MLFRRKLKQHTTTIDRVKKYNLKTFPSIECLRSLSETIAYAKVEYKQSSFLRFIRWIKTDAVEISESVVRREIVNHLDSNYF